MQCCPRDTPHAVRAPTIHSPRPAADLLVVREQSQIERVLDALPPVKEFLEEAYRSPYVEDWFEEDEGYESVTSKDELDIETTLTPGMNHYRTRTCNGGPCTQAQMIGNLPNTHAVPVEKMAGQRRQRINPKRGHLPPLSVPIPEVQPPLLSPNMEDIRWLQASSFVSFCRQDNVRAMRITWDELDQAAERRTTNSRESLNTTTLLQTVHLNEEEYRDILLGEGDLAKTLSQLPPHLHDFVYDCYKPAHLRKISEADVSKFLTGKPELNKLPAFLPRHADTLPPRRAWDHKIELMPGKEPPYFKNRPLSPLELEVVRKWIDDNLSKGFIRESRSRSAAPLLLAAKPGGGVRICQDYRGLNNVTIKNRYPLPIVRETLDALCNATVYTKLDIIAAFNKLRIAEGDEWKTAFITRFGLFESLVMPFGLCNAPASFQHYINHTLFNELDKYCTAYLDDVLVYSADKSEHREHVRTIMDPEKVTAITSWEQPLSVKDLQRFLGFANFYRRFIKDFSKICRPLNDLLRKDIGWIWDASHRDAFATLKDAFITAPVLAYFDHNKRTVLETDASDWASGGVLSQYDSDGLLRPVAYFSAKHSAAECNYEIYDKELLAIIKSMEEWRPELQGSQQEFEILTDHKNLEYFTTTKALNQRQVRWSEFLSHYNFRIVYRPGSKAIRPDALSRKREDRPNFATGDDERLKNRERIVLPADKFDIDLYNELKAGIHLAPTDLVVPAEDKPIDELIDDAYRRSDMAHQLIAAIEDHHVRKWPVEFRKTLRVAMQDCYVANNRIYYRERLWIPPDDELKVQIIYRMHSSGPAGHPGRTKTIDLVSRTYWWPQMHQEIASYVQACELWVRTLTTEELVDVFISRIYTLHGLPDNIISDRGTQFVSGFWSQLAERLAVTLRHSSAFHPQTDGQTERINSVLEQYLRAFVNFHQDDWMQWLPLAEFASNNMTSETTGCSPFFANYGFNPHIGVEPSKPCPPDMTIAQKREFFKGNKTADRMERILSQLQALARQAVTIYEENANRHRIDSPRYCIGQKVIRFPAQAIINESESTTTRDRILEREDGESEPVQKWIFEGVIDNHNEDGHHYLVKWKHYAPTWQPAADLKGNEKLLAEYHRTYPEKPGPPRWVLDDPEAKAILSPTLERSEKVQGVRRSTRERKARSV
ncbi:hypothetical protein DID88_009413 [Monilinia fructigena]|uniref:Reverse transcriptase n=1 Tax=Monilinia fructigena TaxID=38457 RepID=A0A395INQ6_9HELO|nr:hypothetical protein DID88_009413 [Monilinia fructigena]